MIFLIIIVICNIIIYILSTIDVADKIIIDEDAYNIRYIKALNSSIEYHEKRLGRRLTKREYNKLKYKIFNEFYECDNHRQRKV